MAQMYSKSTMVPKEYQANMANCAIAINIARRLNADSFAIMQSMDVIHGRPSWRATFLIAMVNACGRFTPLQFTLEETGKERTVDLKVDYWHNKQKLSKTVPWTYTPTTCTAHATLKATGERVDGPPVSFDMALAEGWVARDGSKWLTPLRDVMIRYRAAAFFSRIYAPEVTLGIPTSDEVHEEMRDVTPRRPATVAADTEPVTVNPFATARGVQSAPEEKPKRRPKKAEVEFGPEHDGGFELEDAAPDDPSLPVVDVEGSES